MEAMASGAERVLDGEEEVKKYTGECRFQGFEFYKIMAMEKGAAQIKNVRHPFCKLTFVRKKLRVAGFADTKVCKRN